MNKPQVSAQWLADLISDKSMLSRKDLARHFGRSLRTIDRWKREKKLPRPTHVHGPMWTPASIAKMEVPK